MLWYQIFEDGPEYEARKKMSVFTPPNLTLKDVHDAVPKHLFKRDTFKSSLYVVQHLLFSYTLFVFATRIDYSVYTLSTEGAQAFTRLFLIPLLWLLYWGMQGILFAGIWCLGTFPLRIFSYNSKATIFVGHEVRASALHRSFFVL